MALLICGKCGKEPNPSKGASHVECPHCGAITDERMAHALGQRVKVEPPPFCVCRYCHREVSCGVHHTTKDIPGVDKMIHCGNCRRMTSFEEAKQLGRQSIEALEKIRAEATKKGALMTPEQIAFYEEAAQRQSDEMPSVIHTDCRSEEGITVGLIDTIINCARLLKGRPVTPAVEQAIKDLNADEDVAAIMVMRTPG